MQPPPPPPFIVWSRGALCGGPASTSLLHPFPFPLFELCGPHGSTPCGFLLVCVVRPSANDRSRGPTTLALRTARRSGETLPRHDIYAPRQGHCEGLASIKHSYTRGSGVARRGSAGSACWLLALMLTAEARLGSAHHTTPHHSLRDDETRPPAANPFLSSH